MKRDRVVQCSATLVLAALSACAQNNITADSAVYLIPGETAVVSTTGDAVTICLKRSTRSGGVLSDAPKPIGPSSVVVLAGPASSTDELGSWLAHSRSSLTESTAAARIVANTEGEHRVMLVNEGGTAAFVTVHIEGADGFRIVQQGQSDRPEAKPSDRGVTPAK